MVAVCEVEQLVGVENRITSEKCKFMLGRNNG